MNSNEKSIPVLPFSGWHILITRPIHQAQALCEMIKKKGGNPVLFPTLEINSVNHPENWIEPLQRLKDLSDFFIFISANAVWPVASYLNKNRTPILAVGPGTESVLIRHGLPVKNRPAHHFSSKGLLELPELEQMLNKNIVIFSGEQGNTLLAETLRQRGATVTQLAVYRRDCPKVDMEPLLECWRNKINIVVSASQESLTNWMNLMGQKGQSYFRGVPLLVISASMRDMALRLNLGYPVLLASDATDSAILDCLQGWSLYARK